MPGRADNRADVLGHGTLCLDLLYTQQGQLLLIKERRYFIIERISAAVIGVLPNYPCPENINLH